MCTHFYKKPFKRFSTSYQKFFECLHYELSDFVHILTSILQCSKNPGAAAEIREIEKTKKYQELANDYHFIPIGIETYGSWGPEGLKLIKTIGKKLKEETGERRSTFYLFQNISIAIQRGNASCVLGTVPHSEGLEEIFEFVSTIPQSGRRSQMEDD